MGSPAEDGAGEDTYTIAIVNGLVNVREEVLDALHELWRSVQQRESSEMEWTIFVRDGVDHIRQRANTQI